MSTRTCGCSRPLGDNRTLCKTCITELEKQLAETGWVTEQLTISLARIKASTSSGARSAVTPLPWDERSARARDQLQAALAKWVRRLINEGITTTYKAPTPRIQLLAAWLLGRLNTISTYEHAWDLAQEITAAVTRARDIATWKAPDRYFLGPCEGRIEDDGVEPVEHPCEGEVYATAGDTEAECIECKRAYNVEAKRAWIDQQMSSYLMTGAQIADACVTLGLGGRDKFREKVRNAVKTWANRNRIVAVGHSETGDPTYRWDDVRPLIEAAYNTPNQKGA